MLWSAEAPVIALGAGWKVEWQIRWLVPGFGGFDFCRNLNKVKIFLHGLTCTVFAVTRDHHSAVTVIIGRLSHC